MDRFFKAVLTVCLLILASAMVLSPASCIAAARASLTLCLQVVIPSLFPFFVCSNLFISLGAANLLSRRLSPLMRPLFGVPGGGALAVVLGFVSGYPIGASCVAGLYASGGCTKTEAERLLTFCNNAGPLFVLGAVGIGMLQNRTLGLLLYLSHILAALLTGILFRRRGAAAPSPAAALPPAPASGIKNTAAAIGIAVSDAVDAIFKVCGFVLLFAVFCAALPPWQGRPFVYALLEITGGIKDLLQSRLLPQRFLLPVLSFFLSLSGVSVLLQTASILSPVGLSLRPYLLGKLLQGILSFFLTWLFCHLFPIPTPTFYTFFPFLFTLTAGEAFSVSLKDLCFALSLLGILLLCPRNLKSR